MVQLSLALLLIAKAHLQLQTAGHSQLGHFLKHIQYIAPIKNSPSKNSCEQSTFRFRGWIKQSKILFKSILFWLCPFQTAYNVKWFLWYLWRHLHSISLENPLGYGVRFESHRYEIASLRIAEFMFQSSQIQNFYAVKGFHFQGFFQTIVWNTFQVEFHDEDWLCPHMFAIKPANVELSRRLFLAIGCFFIASA